MQASCGGAKSSQLRVERLRRDGKKEGQRQRDTERGGSTGDGRTLRMPTSQETAKT